MKKLFYIGALSALLVGCSNPERPIPEDKFVEYPIPKSEFIEFPVYSTEK